MCDVSWDETRGGYVPWVGSRRCSCGRGLDLGLNMSRFLHLAPYHAVLPEPLTGVYLSYSLALVANISWWERVKRLMLRTPASRPLIPWTPNNSRMSRTTFSGRMTAQESNSIITFIASQTCVLKQESRKAASHASNIYHNVRYWRQAGDMEKRNRQPLTANSTLRPKSPSPHSLLFVRICDMR